MKLCSCGNQCANNARSCPKCGHRFTSSLTMAVALFFGFIFLMGIIGAAIGDSDSSSSPATPVNTAQKQKEEAEWQRAVIGARTLEKAARNPDSFTLSQVLIMNDGSVCYTYRAQNGFGGMSVGRAVVNASGKIRNDTDDGFRTLWNKECANKTGTEETWKVNYAIGKESILGK